MHSSENAIAESKTHVIREVIAKTKGDKKELFEIVKTLLCLKKLTVLPEYHDPLSLASRFNQFFVDKIDNIRAEFPQLEKSLPLYTFGTMDSILPKSAACTAILENFTLVTNEEVQYRSASLSINPASRAGACTDCEYIECTIAIIIIVILVPSLFLVEIMCSFG